MKIAFKGILELNNYDEGDTKMLIIKILIMICIFKFLPKVKEKVNLEYEKRFNIKMFAKENFKIPFIGSLLIIVGTLYSSSNDISGMILVIIGIIMILYAIYLMYKKTDLLYGTIAAVIYTVMVILYLILGFSLIFLVFAVILLSARKDRYYDD